MKKTVPECRVETPKSADIRFDLQPPRHYPRFRKSLMAAYRKRYPSLQIEALHIAPTSLRDTLTSDRGCSLRLTPAGLRRDHGTFVAKCGKERHFFRYDLKGSITVYKANHQIKKDKIISLDSVSEATLPFRKFGDTPLWPLHGKGLIARRNIRAGEILTKRMTAPLPDVRKHDRVHCLYDEGAVHIEFDAIALKNGYRGEMITVKKGNGRVMTGIVKGRGLVELR
ncbi:flagellar basal body P-ring formation chaperone FlgA [Hydrogenimonas sp. SS33]|uniref:flagellar basal body P-ring formation chaperone FlgA n=1 Tax=Hydrogenimonas leucolamina TaxID=2954236 RepID=UPI00336C1520